MLKLKKLKIVYINVRHERSDMNGIFGKSENRSIGLFGTRPSESVETAGSLAMNNQFHSLFSTNIYDVFSSSNPFAVDYSQYSDCSDCVAYSGFLSSFSNAVSTISGFSDGGFSGISTGDCGGGFSGASCGSSSGGFTSFC